MPAHDGEHLGIWPNHPEVHQREEFSMDVLRGLLAPFTVGGHVMVVVYGVPVLLVTACTVALRARHRWAPAACLALTVMVLTAVGLAAGWQGFTWSISSLVIKTLVLAADLALPPSAAFVAVSLARRRRPAVQVAWGITLGALAALVAPTVGLVAVCGLTGDCL